MSALNDQEVTPESHWHQDHLTDENPQEFRPGGRANQALTYGQVRDLLDAGNSLYICRGCGLHYAKRQSRQMQSKWIYAQTKSEKLEGRLEESQRALKDVEAQIANLVLRGGRP